jgi:2-amino-4-hydroxy-6-hydroxymethyldihydropteridine diphosphokinase
MTSLWQPAYIALGSNLNEPAAQIRAAVERIRALPQTRFYALSPLYDTAPMGPQNQPHFVNAVAGVLSQLEPRALLNHLLDIERALGRHRGAEAEQERWGPRIIDLDLIAVGALRVDEPGLQLPHPGISERNFVLYPLRDIAADFSVPHHGRVSDLAARVDSHGIVPIE